MSDDGGVEHFVELKHDACEAVAIATRDVRLDPQAPQARLERTLDQLSVDPDVDAIFVQAPLPEHVSTTVIRRRIDPRTDVDCFHPETFGRLVAGTPRFVPATTAAVTRLLDAYDIAISGSDVVIVGRSPVIGRPLATHLLQDAPHGTATVTSCHSQTPDLAAHTRRADVLVTACGVPGLVDGAMLTEGVVVVDVSTNRRERRDGDADGSDVEVVGDVAFESAREPAAAITPVPGGVGPLTIACLLDNVVQAVEVGAGRK